MRKNLMRNAVVAASVVALGAGSLIAGAGAADAEKLPNGSRTATGVDGQKVTVKRTGERSIIMPSMAANFLERTASISGTYSASVNKGSGILRVGYLVGCQVNLEGLGFEGGPSAGLGLNLNDFTPTLNVDLGGSITVPLNPGEVKLVQGEGVALHDGKGAVIVDGFEVTVPNCGGFASARSLAKVTVAEDLSTDDGISGKSGILQTSLYGKPFSLG